MTRATEMRGNPLLWAAVAAGGVLAGLALPRLRRSLSGGAKAAFATTYTSTPAGEPPHADPRRGRPT